MYRLCLLLCLALTGAAGALGETVLADFDGGDVPGLLRAEEAGSQVIAARDEEGGWFELQWEDGARSPGVALEWADGPRDWSGNTALAFRVLNPNDWAVELMIRVESRNGAGQEVRARQRISIPAGADWDVPFFFGNANAGPYWGMQGIPRYGPIMYTGLNEMKENVFPGAVLRVDISVFRPRGGGVICLDDLAVVTADSPRMRLVEHPFVDRFGQYMHGKWVGKIGSQAELEGWRDAEFRQLAGDPAPESFDVMGGWKDGPQLAATGHFRTEQVGGKWWLVTPGGRLFFSLGVNCVRVGDSTFVTGRDDWFAWLPKAGEPEALFLTQRDGVHSRAEPIGGKGQQVNFFGINLMRKYGEYWAQDFVDTAEKRLRSWGFNTVGNWSSPALLREDGLAYTVTASTPTPMVIEGVEGYWGKLKDVYTPGFAADTERAMENLLLAHKDRPNCIGFFVDNEMSWNNLARGTLESPERQPARAAFVQMLRDKYKTIEALNEAWSSEAASWAEVRLPSRRNDAARADAEAYEYAFAREYFGAVKDAIDKHAPGKLYLGCRFVKAFCPDAVMRAAAELCDVLSINAYATDIPADLMHEYDMPVIIGEFHFGALDRGMLHPGLQAVENQRARGEAYDTYVRSVAANPYFVGCHWFQYMDQPVTGRSLDGENFNIGLVNVADVPYPELVLAARRLHQTLYGWRHGGAE